MSGLLSNPIYQHSGETEKMPAVAQQSSINEDLEQRRRLLDKTGEQHKKLLANEVSHLVDQFASNIHLKNTPYVESSKPILQQAQEGASSIFSSALAAGKSMFNTATHAANSAIGTATNVANSAIGTASYAANSAIGTASYAANSAIGTATNVASSALDTATNVASSALNTASHVGHDAAVKANELAHGAANQASNLANKVVDTTSSAAGAVSQKSKQLANVANDKAHELADNISSFTTLVGVLAEEENERARRLVSGDEALAAANAFRVSGLIRDLGESFYRQPTPSLLYATKILEESERRWRLHTGKSIEANAHKESLLVQKSMKKFEPRYKWARKHIAVKEEKERLRRINSPSEAWAIMNGLSTASLIRELGEGSYRQGPLSRTHAGYATTLLEENERRDRIRTYNLTHPLDSHTVLSDVVANNLEKLSYSTRNAAKLANDFASLVGNVTLRVASQVSSQVQSQVSSLTPVVKDLANNAAEKVKTAAGDLKSYTTTMYVIALEEKERARRLADSDEITSIRNAWFQSQLIRDLPALYRSSSLARFPLGLIEEQERRWRLASVTPSSSRTLASFVKANASKFEAAMLRAEEKERAHADAVAHSRLNPRAAPFVPKSISSSNLLAKVEPAVIPPASVASSAQL